MVEYMNGVTNGSVRGEKSERFVHLSIWWHEGMDASMINRLIREMSQLVDEVVTDWLNRVYDWMKEWLVGLVDR